MSEPGLHGLFDFQDFRIMLILASCPNLDYTDYGIIRILKSW